MLNAREYRHLEKSLPDLLNPAFMLDDGVLLNKDGSLSVVLHYRGPDLHSSSESDMERLSATINHAFNMLGTGWSLHAHAIRSYSEGYIAEGDSFFADPISALIDSERRNRYEAEGAHLESRFSLTLTWRLPTVSEQNLAKLVISNPKQAENNVRRHVQWFLDKIDNLVGILRARMVIHRMNSDELLTHYHECLTGLSHPVKTPKIPAYLDALLGHHDAVTGFTPIIAGQHVHVISFMDYPQESSPEILEHLTALPFPIQWATRFIFMDPFEAVGLLGKYRRNWFQKRHGVGALIAESMGGQGSAFQDQDALLMTADADNAVAEASSGQVRFGYFTANIVLRATDETTLDEMSKQVVNMLNNTGFVTNVESVNTMEALLGSLPGHTFENIRRPLIHTLNLADLMPSTSIWPGPKFHPCPYYEKQYQKMFSNPKKKAPPLLYAATTGWTPYRMVLHDGDVGHTLIVGPTGAGKSSLLAFIAAQHRRYPDAQIFAFDKGNSMFPLVKGCTGDHYDIAGDNADIAFAPLSRINEGRTEQEWAAEWIEELCIIQGMVPTPAERRLIFDAVRRLAVQESRTITDFANTVASAAVREAIGFYRISGGRGGYLLDAEADSLRLDRCKSPFVVFEMEHLLSAGGAGDKKMIVPVLSYIFHRIEQMLKGQPSLLLLDESWIFLDNPIFAAKIREWLKVLRKANCAVVFATQSVMDLADKPGQPNVLRPVIMESCKTRILLPNSEALSEQLLPIYRDMGLSHRQIEIVASSQPKQDYYVTNPQGGRLIQLELGPIALSFVGASGKEDLQRVRELIALYGDSEWAMAWLRERRVI
jgi:type IV secretion system protein VirB4